MDLHLVLHVRDAKRAGFDSREGRASLKGSIRELLLAAPRGVTGIQLAVDGLPPAGADYEGLLELLAELRAELAPEMEVGIACPRWAWDGRETEEAWSANSLGRLASVADYMVVRNYGGGRVVRNQEGYGCLTRDAVEVLAPWLGKQLVVGVPAYGRDSPHASSVESVEGAVGGS